MKLIIVLLMFFIGNIVSAQNPLVQNFLDKGKAEFKKPWDKQNYAVAVENFEKAVALQPDNTEAHYFLGYAYDKLNAKDGSSMNNLNINLTMKASAEYEKVISLSPKYEGEITLLDPYSRLTSIWGSQAMSYIYHNKLDSAKWCFRKGKELGGFDDFFLAINRKTLDLCTNNSILVTMGDNVTIPLWYLQIMEKYRGDVQVIDANLLNSRWYPHYIKMHSKNLISYTIAELDTLNYKKWDSTNVSINIPQKNKTFSWLIPPSYANEYLLRGDRLVLNILQQNKFKKDVYFTSGYNPNSMLGLRKYLKYNILIDKISPFDSTQLSDEQFYNLANQITSIFKYVNPNSQDNLHFIDMFRYIILDRMHIHNDDQHLGYNLKLLGLLDDKAPENKFPILSKNLKDFMDKLHKDNQ